MRKGDFRTKFSGIVGRRVLKDVTLDTQLQTILRTSHPVIREQPDVWQT